MTCQVKLKTVPVIKLIKDNIIEFKNNDLNHVLEKEYDEIIRNMEKEDYIVEYTSFYQFHELKYDDKTVGFFTLDNFLPSEKLLCLNECYILPRYRGKDILINIIKDYLENEKIRFYIRKPNKNFIKFMIKHGLAFEVAPDIAVSHIKFITYGRETYSNKKIKRLYRSLNEENENLQYYSAGFHMGLCSVFCLDPFATICKNDSTLMLHFPRKEDLKKYNLRKKLKNITVNKLRDIQNDYAINKDKIDKFHAKLSDELNENNDDILVLGHGDDILVFENLKPNDGILIDQNVTEAFMNHNLNFSTCDIRFEYLLNHPEKIGKSITIEPDEQFDKCPFCESPVGDEEYCKTCGQLLEDVPIESIMNDFMNRLEENFSESEIDKLNDFKK